MHSPIRKTILLARIAEIDSWLEDAAELGGCLASMSKEREFLVNQLRGDFDTIVPHKCQLKVSI